MKKRMFFWFVIALIFIASLYKVLPYTLRRYHSFLSMNKPVDADILVVEGWLFDYMLKSAKSTFEQGGYRYIITTGTCPKTSEDTNMTCNAESAAKKLAEFGLDPKRIYPASTPNVKDLHTYYSAMALKRWLSENAPEIKAVNVFTGGPHGKKTYHFFKRVLGPDIDIGIISSRIEHYDPEQWWMSQRGRHVTFRYSLGYLHSLFFSEPHKR